jgi:hypothetical protein
MDRRNVERYRQGDGLVQRDLSGAALDPRDHGLVQRKPELIETSDEPTLAHAPRLARLLQASREDRFRRVVVRRVDNRIVSEHLSAGLRGNF